MQAVCWWSWIFAHKVCLSVLFVFCVCVVVFVFVVCFIVLCCVVVCLICMRISCRYKQQKETTTYSHSKHHGVFVFCLRVWLCVSLCVCACRFLLKALRSVSEGKKVSDSISYMQDMKTILKEVSSLFAVFSCLSVFVCSRFCCVCVCACLCFCR